ncbi:uncharacterized protein LOC18048806 isoform X3 [Citrus clementina]|uniref:uncharacterized protein LOC18048806 isoform X3 n=1 Tax=Citrus clementina TaxID=85681 RepID=UPI000CED4BC4|nr:uncharacterized protein LOC18048806 isoform X3 [Citrus x clementina]
MGKKDLSEWRPDVGQYLGEISALCFVHLPSHLSSLPFLLAGSGSQVLLYDLEAGTLIRPFQVFHGIRLHGISCNFINCTEGSVSTRVTFEVALFGEKRVKLFELNFELSPNSQYQPETCVNLSLVQSLPRLSHWVFDVCFLKVCNGNRSLAIGCSDNSIRVWDISNSSIILEVHSPERCLLYSMKLWGDNLEALRIASGTIYNEIIVWKVDWEHVAPLLNSPEGNHAHGSSSDFKCFKLQDQQHTAVNLFRLVGHEGSIFRIEWSSCGSKLVSVSDDRSARIWEVRAEYWKDSDSIEEVGSSVLYGHNARVWDCCLTDSFIITAGEDCTCRVWGSDGKQLKMIKEHMFIFTADPKGRLKLWQLCDPFSSVCYESSKTNNVFLVAEFSSCFGARIMCLDASFEDEVLFCGDLRGNLVLFPLLRDLLNDKSVALHVEVSPLNYFKGAHGISTVSTLSVAKLRSNQTEIRSTGGDGCICYLEYDKDRESLEFIGMKQVKELSLIQSVSAENNSIDLASCNYAAGFASTDFIIWNLITEAKVVQIPCGGWRRPHSYFLGDVPEIKNCFAYVKDEVIHIHRHWISNGERKMFPKNLHMQFHGREIHTLCFVSENFQVGANVKKSALNKSSWIATGCEDGTVRLTRYSPGFENWSSSKLLGEHVGGSAVRSICFVSEINQISAVVDNVSEEINRQNGVAEDKENPFLLISVGAKRVLTSWLLRHRGIDEMEETTVESKYNRNGNDLELSLGASSSLSFQWLSTDMPTKNSSTHGKKKDMKKVDHITRNIASMNANAKTGSISSESREREAKAFLGDKYEDDWRYLAVTAFLVKCPGSRLTVCFVVVACSDATLALRALILPLRLWFEVAMLVPLSSPVLALQHVIMPIHLPSKENVQIGSSYFVISGATDGSIAFWDVTGHVETFVQQVSTLHIENFIDCQKRPRTGRGSQGGRWWRNLRHTRPNKESGSSIVSVRTEGGVQNHDACGVSAKVNDTENCTVEDGQIASCEPELNAVNSTSETSEIRPIHILNNAHQSGVNCLHVSKIKNCWSTECGFHFYVVSGGDDQAIHCLRVDLSLLSRGPDSEIIAADVINSNSESEDVKSLIYYGQEQNQNYRIRFYNYFRATSAHSSAIKGIWTDGTWVFSTGLDQRIRFWLLEEHSILSQHAHLVVSVPEPEALSARACGRNHYEIAVAGRGMQMVEFHASTDIDEEQ